MASLGKTVELTASDALALRMRNLMLGAEHPASGLDSAGALARWFGAMQAQDLASLQWSLGLRLGATLPEVEAELEKGEALRTWPMRGTIHLVPAEDAAWMVRVFGEKPLAGAAKRREHLGLSEKDADRAVELLREALAGGGRLTRSECIAALDAGGVSGAGQRGYHLLWYASQRGVTCIGPSVDGEQTFVLLDEWVRRCCGGPRESCHGNRRWLSWRCGTSSRMGQHRARTSRGGQVSRQRTPRPGSPRVGTG